MQYNELSAAERIKLRERTRPALDKLAAGYDPELVKLYQTESSRIHSARRARATFQ